MDMQYQYTEKYVKDIAEAIRFIAGSTDTYSIKEMPAAIAAANPPILGKPEDLFEAQFNAQLSAGTAQCLNWAIFSKYPDDSYFVISNHPESLTNTQPVIKIGMLFNEDFTEFIPYRKFNVDAGYNQWTIYFTRGENSDACGITLDSDGNPHIDKDMPFIMPTGPRTNYASRGFNANNGFFYSAFHNTGTYNLNDSSVWSYLVSGDGDITKSPVFKNRFKAFGASNLNGRIPSEIYSVISDGDWHNGLTITQNIRTFINPVETPSGVTISGACIFNTIGYVDNVIQFKNYYSGPSWLYYRDANDHLRFNTTNKTFYNNNNNNLKSYFTHFRQTQNTLNGYGIYPWNDGANKVTITLSSYDDQRPNMMEWQGSYDAPASTEDLKSYIPFRTYDILDQNGNILLPANATLADFGIS